MRGSYRHGCLYYIFIWPFVIIIKISFHLCRLAIKLCVTIIKTLLGLIFPQSHKNYASMTGLEFEEHAAKVLKSKGFKNVEVTQGSGDQGIDILASKKGKKYAIQAKNYSHPVGNKAVQEAFAGCSFYKCDIPVVLTNSTFTDAAKELATSINVELWNIDKL